MRVLIVTGGFVDDEFTLAYVKRENYDAAFAVDKGLMFFYRNQLTPDYIVGDFDSVEETTLQWYETTGSTPQGAEGAGAARPEARFMPPGSGSVEERANGGPKIIRLNPRKDDTDTEHALQMALALGAEKIDVFGATGTRLDHVLGNLQLLGFCLRRDVECQMIDPWNRVRLIHGETVLEKATQFGKYVSLIPYTPQVTGLTLTGFAYPLTDYTMSSFYVEGAQTISGVSNEIAEETARITLKEGILVLVESRD